MKKETLRDLRESTKKTCAEVAQALGVTINAIYNYENGIRRISLEQVLALADVYEVSAGDVIKAQLNSCQFYQSGNQR